MKVKTLLYSISIFFLIVLTLSGCGKQKEEKAKPAAPPPPPAQTSVNPPSVSPVKKESSEGSHAVKPVKPHPVAVSCDRPKTLSPEDQLTCTAKKAWKLRYENGNVNPEYISAFRQGAIAVLNGSQNDHYLQSKNVSPVAEAGYQDGHEHVFKTMGVTRIHCSDEADNPSEYHKLWCHLEKKYFSSKKSASDDNPVIKDRFIAGYISGQSIAPLLPEVMKSAVQTRNYSVALKTILEKSNAITSPPADAPAVEKAFYDGFVEGFGAMVLKIKQSFEQINKQLKMNHDG